MAFFPQSGANDLDDVAPPQDPSPGPPKETREFEILLREAKKIKDAGHLVVAIGTTTVVTMLNMAAVAERTISDSARDFALNIADHCDEYRNLETAREKFEWIEYHANKADNNNRNVADNSSLLHGVITAMNGLKGVRYSAEGKNFPGSTKLGHQRVEHNGVVRGYISAANKFVDNSTRSLMSSAFLIADNIAEMHDEAPSFNLAFHVTDVVVLKFEGPFDEPTAGNKRTLAESSQGAEYSAVGPKDPIPLVQRAHVDIVVKRD